MTKKTKKTDKTNLLFGIKFFSKGEGELLSKLENSLNNSSKISYIVTPNPEQVVQSSRDNQFLKNLQAADISVPDGVGIVWASLLLSFFNTSSVITQRIAGADLVSKLLDLAKTKGYKILVIGGKGYRSPKDKNVFWLEGYADIQNPSKEEEQAVAAAIKKFKPDIVFVAFGAPFQEQWAVDHKQVCQKVGVKILMVVGGSFDYLWGSVPRAPKIIRVLGLEWLFRLVRQPWRWRRQLRLISFIGLIIAEILKRPTRR